MCDNNDSCNTEAYQMEVLSSVDGFLTSSSSSTPGFHLPLHCNPPLPELVPVNSLSPDINPNTKLSTSEFCDVALNEIPCDACSFCNDTCDNTSCQDCRFQCSNDSLLSKERFISMCELRRHDSINSAWLLIDKHVYDVTNYIENHPGGIKSILKFTGGAKNCKEDMGFHSKAANKMIKQYRIGKIAKSICPGSGVLSRDEYNDACSIM